MVGLLEEIQTLEQVDAYKYLRVIVRSNGRDKTEIAWFVAKARSAVYNPNRSCEIECLDFRPSSKWWDAMYGQHYASEAWIIIFWNGMPPANAKDHVDGQCEKRGRTCKVWSGLFRLVIYWKIAWKATNGRRISSMTPSNDNRLDEDI